MQDKLLTIFTSTYNRKELLFRLYQSLCSQINQNFKWLIIDDGSTDGTEAEVEKWQKEQRIEIAYYYKENHGLSSGYNEAIKHLDTELAQNIDSDDYFGKQATDTIQKYWEQYGKDDDCAGLVGMVASPDGKILCNRLTTGKKYNFLITGRRWEYGDKNIAVRSKYYKEVAPVRLYDDERGISPHILHQKICEKHYFVAIGEVFSIVDYQLAGMGRNMIKQYVESPKSFADLREYALTKCKMPPDCILKSAVHYDASCIIAKQLKEKLPDMPKKYLTWPLIPVGYAAAWVIMQKYNKKYGKKR